jgi:hypothetical protein
MTRASKPVNFFSCPISASGLVFLGSYSTTALAFSKETSAWYTPSTRWSAIRAALAQPPQVIPLIASFTVAVSMALVLSATR